LLCGAGGGGGTWRGGRLPTGKMGIDWKPPQPPKKKDEVVALRRNNQEANQASVLRRGGSPETVESYNQVIGKRSQPEIALGKFPTNREKKGRTAVERRGQLFRIQKRTGKNR